MNKEIIKRIEEEAEYIVDTKETIRQIAKQFSISKSTVHKDIGERLKEIDIEKYEMIQSIFKDHIKIRHILGGQSTKRKYLQLRKKQ